MVACAPTLSVYDDAQFECLEQQPQHKGAEIAAALRSEAALAVDAEIQARRTCLALARVQRTVHPLQYPFSPSGPLALASAHMDLADAYRAARLHAQVCVGPRCLCWQDLPASHPCLQRKGATRSSRSLQARSRRRAGQGARSTGAG